ncbi:MAG: acyltransferase family protein [Lachnospiraceae bacterium]|nr:acyltransferase family protein [Lachnospiraceae bacterium]
MGEKTGKGRELWVDVIRGFTIYLVVLGHCIQYATPHNYDFHSNVVFRLIYGFHMPLFMIVSGYLFWYSLNRYSLLDGVLAKIKGIMIPCFAWGIVTYVCDILMTGYRPIGILACLRYTVFSNWFLWAVFYCSLYGFATKYLFRGSIWGYMIVIIVNCMIPDFGNYAGTKRMLPFFIMGMLVNRFGILDKMREYKTILFTMALLLSGTYLIAVKFECVELITGTIGSAAAILIFSGLCRRFQLKILRMLGEVSISIYLFTGIVFYFWIKEYCRISDAYRYRFKVMYVVLLSLGLTAAAFGLSRLLKKNATVSRLFLGR